jgi:hypothetical protein
MVLRYVTEETAAQWVAKGEELQRQEQEAAELDGQEEEKEGDQGGAGGPRGRRGGKGKKRASNGK